MFVHHHRPGHQARAEKRGAKRSREILLGLIALLTAVLIYRHFTLLAMAPDSTSVSASRDVFHPDDMSKFHPGDLWLDQQGNPIQAHGGSVLLHKGIYYWYGEDKGGPTFVPPQRKLLKYNPPRVDVIGVRCYSSTDLLKWRDEGLVLRAGQHPDLAPTRVLERPRVLYNEWHRTFVMWMHVDDTHYEEARAGVAWSLTPTGPFHYMGSARPNGQMSRDMTLFKDDDGRAYLLYSSEDNLVLHIAELWGDYLSVRPTFTRALAGLAREAPALFKHQGRYFLFTSGCTGWLPNAAEVFVAHSPKGPWQSLGNPCRDVDPTRCNVTFHSQGTFVLPAPGRAGREGHFVLMADRWDVEDLGDSRYVWLPLWVEADRIPGSVVLRWFAEWDLGVFDQYSSNILVAR